MLYRVLADVTLLMHLGFILFAIFGAFLVIKHSLWMVLHLPALAWGACVEFFSLTCPLTALENHWRILAGEQGYQAGFIEHYLLPVIYPEGLDARLQWQLGVGLLLINLALYGSWFYLKRR